MDYELQNSLIHQFHRASQLINELFVSMSDSQKLTPRQLIVLGVLANHNDGMSQADIVNLTSIDRSTMADIVGRMIKNGLLARTRNESDRRAYTVEITKHGRDVLKTAAVIAQKVEQSLLQRLPLENRSEFRMSLAMLLNEEQSSSTEN